jgi:hypothetical protein
MNLKRKIQMSNTKNEIGKMYKRSVDKTRTEGGLKGWLAVKGCYISKMDGQIASAAVVEAGDICTH